MSSHWWNLMVRASDLVYLGIPLRVAMLRGSLSLGPTLRSGLPPYGRHHSTALMRKKEKYDDRKENHLLKSSPILSLKKIIDLIPTSALPLVGLWVVMILFCIPSTDGQNQVTQKQFEEKKEQLKFDKTKRILQPKSRGNDTDLLTDNFPRRTSGGEGISNLRQFLNFLGYLIIGGIILMVIILVVKDYFRSKQVQKLPITDPLEETGNIEELDLTAMHSNALAAQDYRLALRLLFLQALKSLSLQNELTWQPHKTNRTYIHEIKNTQYKRSFRQLVSIFEYTWYGIAQVDADLYQVYEPRFSSFLQTLANER